MAEDAAAPSADVAEAAAAPLAADASERQVPVKMSDVEALGSSLSEALTTTAGSSATTAPLSEESPRAAPSAPDLLPDAAANPTIDTQASARANAPSADALRRAGTPASAPAPAATAAATASRRAEAAKGARPGKSGAPSAPKGKSTKPGEAKEAGDTCLDGLYTVVGTVGRGSFGTIWLVRSTYKGGDLLALKEIPFKGLAAHEVKAAKVGAVARTCVPSRAPRAPAPARGDADLARRSHGDG